MADYVEVNGVRTWYDERGEGDPLVLLHGGFSDSRDFTLSLAALAGDFTLLMPDRRGHGRTPDVPGPITLDVMAEDTIAFLGFAAERTGRAPHLAGYSIGGTIALLAAMRRPDLVRGLVLISTGFRDEGWIFAPSGDATGMPERIVAAYAEVSPDGRDHFPIVVGKIMDGIAAGPLAVGEDELAKIPSRTLVMAADDDIIHLEHTLALYRAIPDSELAVIPGTSHVLLQEKPELCARTVRAFLTEPPAPTFIPIRRAPR
ncbi:alpha/beta fold hydrolase [Sphaerisporangium fuscum]|uniref:alpha/beta fold hydrolase n=1 Tax=Sphaerisporangium fuscum TaxID=2835868 RepID=UPI001BDC3123|nr:alpha/beta hydrolase [Sphaerisporangium fuscum]